MCSLGGEEQSCFGSVCPFFPRFGCVVSPLVTNQFVLSLFRLSRAAWLLAEELRTFPERHRWYTGSRHHLCSGYTPPPCWKTCRTCSSPPPGETEPGWSPGRFYSWRGDSWRGRLRFLGQRKTECEGGRGMAKNDKSDNLQEKKRALKIRTKEPAVSHRWRTWAGRGTDPRWAHREPGTLFCPTGEGSFHGCNVRQSPKSKNTSALTGSSTTRIYYVFKTS